MPVLTIPDSNWTCAVDDPSKVVSLMGVGGFPDVAQCAMQCTGDVDCKGFNLKINASLCEMYLYIPTRFTLVPDCQYRQVTLKSIKLHYYVYVGTVVGTPNLLFIYRTG